MNIGMKIYYDKATGNVIHNTGEYVGRGYVETTEDQDFASIKELAQRVRETVAVIKLQYGQYSREFAQCDSYRVDSETGELVFTYLHEPNPLEGRMAAVEAGAVDTAQQLADALERLNETQAELQVAKQEAVDAQVGLAELYELVLAGQQPEAPDALAGGGEDENG